MLCDLVATVRGFAAFLGVLFGDIVLIALLFHFIATLSEATAGWQSCQEVADEALIVADYCVEQLTQCESLAEVTP